MTERVLETAPGPALDRKRSPFAAFLVFFKPRTPFSQSLLYTSFIYVVGALLMPVNAFWTPDGGGKFFEMLHLHWTGSGISGWAPYAAQAVDPAMKMVTMPQSYIPAPGGGFDSYFPIWLPLISKLPYALFGLRGLVLFPAAGGIATALFAGLIAERRKPGRGWIALLLTAFATPMLFYGQTFWEHSIATGFALAGLYVLLTAGDTAASTVATRGHLARLAPTSSYALSLLLIAVSALFRPEMLLVALCCGVWLAFRLARWGGAAGLATAGAGLLAALASVVFIAASSTYRQAVLGNAGVMWHRFTTARALPWDRGLGLLWERISYGLYNIPNGADMVVPVFFVFTGVATALAIISLFLPARARAITLAACGLLMAAPAGVNAFSPVTFLNTHGIVLSAPFVLAAIVLWPAKERGSGLMAALIVGFVVMDLLFLDGGTGTADGPEWGPRGILLIYPLAAILLATASFDLGGKRLSQLGLAASGLLVLLSFTIQGRGVANLRANLAEISRWTETLNKSAAPIVLTNIFWLDSEVTPAMQRHEFVLLPQAQQASAVAYFWSQPRVHSSVVTYVELHRDNAELPVPLSQYFQVIGKDDVEGLSLRSLKARPVPLTTVQSRQRQ